MQSATNKATATVPVRYEALDGFRGVLALLVCLHHILVWNSLFLWSRYLHPILDLFFLLSGFVLAMTYDTRIRNGRSFADFFVRRAGRLWPVHLCVLGVMVGLETIRAIRGYMFDRSDIVTFTGTKTLGSAVENFFLVQGWGYNKPFTWNVPSWTLSTELIAYALLGLILLSTTRKSLRIAAALLLATGSTALLAYQTDFMRRAPNVNVAWCLQGFFFGYVLYHVWHRWPIASRWWGTAAEVGLLVACTVMLSFKVTGFIMFVWLACAVALLHALA
ncbi:MAG: acyltransferase, partial [Planctomycetaceae bacterium]